MNTFRGTLGASMLRGTLYQKNTGDVAQDELGLVRTSSPISGSLLLSRSTAHGHVKDPMTGTTLHRQGATAVVSTPVQKQQLRFSKKFYLTKDVDISLQTLRNTTTVTRYTNEKVGTAGTPTGMGSSLKAYQEVRAQMAETARRAAQQAAAAEQEAH